MARTMRESAILAPMLRGATLVQLSLFGRNFIQLHFHWEATNRQPCAGVHLDWELPLSRVIGISPFR